MDLDRALRISAAGMQAQSTRLRVVAENLANRDSTAETPGGDPYRRRTVSFQNRMDRALGTATVRVSRIGTAPGDFPQRHDPSHPAADARGYVRVPNVDSLIETMDMREAQRSYAANLSVLEVTRGMLTRTIEALRGVSLPLAPAGAAAAYRAADALPGAATQGASGGAGFGAALTRAMEHAVEVGREADTASTRALGGQGSVTDVVLAVGRAELTLQTAVAVRDRVVAAYQDVMRMPI